MYREAIPARAGDIWFWSRVVGAWFKLLPCEMGTAMRHFRANRVPLCFVKRDEFPQRVCDMAPRGETLHCA